MSCAASPPATAPVPAPPPAAPAVPAPPASAAPGGTPHGAPPAERGSPDDGIQRERWVGTLELTKGEQPMIAGRLMSREDAERVLGPDWRALRGRRVRVLASLRDHVCEPEAQCLTGGRIPLLENVASIELCSPADSTVQPAGVDCAPGAAEVAICEAECQSRSQECSERAPDRGALRRCGCAKVSCEQACKSRGEAQFVCR
ncbi:hypothetical protein [Sorangium sp. So ce131]|uniref:hypothetical protein n=1 Tax=Sorangium sp. So ce131 TaxID=3133282 RepID=UPI003F5D6680